jgi:hypothetical protein
MEMTCAWQETDTVPPVTVQVLTIVVAVGCWAAVVKGADDGELVRVAAVAVGLGELVVSDVSSEEGDGSVVAEVGVPVCVAAVDVAAARVALAASSRSATCGAERIFVDAPSLNTATARQTTKLVTAVARTHDAAAIPAMRRREVFATPQS